MFTSPRSTLLFEPDWGWDDWNQSPYDPADDTWTDQEGREIPVALLTDRHLRNIHRLLTRGKWRDTEALERVEQELATRGMRGFVEAPGAVCE